MPQLCSGGHENPDGAQFCAVCGLAMTSIRSAPSPGLPSGTSPAGNPGPWPPPAPPAPPSGYWGNAGGPYGGAPTAGVPAAPPQNGMGIAGLVLGIAGLFFFGFILGILAIIFSSIGLQRANNGMATNKTMAIWGLILGIIGLVAWTLFLLA